MNDSNWKDTNPKDAAAAIDGRVPLELFPDTAIVAGALAMWEGACKYGRYNYRVAGVKASVYAGAEARHMKSWWNGQDIDPKSGLPHLYKALACIAILIDAEACGMLKDDRPPKAPVEAMLEDLQPIVREIAERLKEYAPYQYTIADSRPEGGDHGATARVEVFGEHGAVHGQETGEVPGRRGGPLPGSDDGGHEGSSEAGEG